MNNTTGFQNTALGKAAGDNITTGSSNIIIGANVDAPSATGSNQLNIGNNLYGDGKRLWVAGNNNSSTWHYDITGTAMAIGNTSNQYLQIKTNISTTTANKMFDISFLGRTHYSPDYVDCGINGYAYANASTLFYDTWNGSRNTQGGVVDAYRSTSGYVCFTISVPQSFDQAVIQCFLSGGGSGGYGMKIELLQWTTLSSNYHYL